MDNLVLIRVAAHLRRTLIDAVVEELREEAAWRFRLRLLQGDERRSVLISLDPRDPWIGRPSAVWRLPSHPPSPFTAIASRSLRGGVLVDLEKPPAERRVTFRLADGRALVGELYPHGANLVLLDSSGQIEATAHRPGRTQRARLAARAPYRPRDFPPRQIDPFEATPDEIRSHVENARKTGLSPEEALSRSFLGLGRVASGLLVAEAERSGRDLAELVKERLAGLLEASHDPVIQGSGRLLPWAPPGEDSLTLSKLDDPASTAGLFHDTAESARIERRRAESLVAILDREARRMREVEAKVVADLEAFEDPARFRHWAEALLAGLHEARRVGDYVIVPDPYDPDRAPLPVPVQPGQSPTTAAERLFVRHRRALRGNERARRRAAAVGDRRLRLEQLRERFTDGTDAQSADALEREMQGEGIPVGLEPTGGGKARGTTRTTLPRLEGVRLFTSSDGIAVLVGKSGRDNDRLTFKLAGPEDFWLHALGVPGAHVVVRNERREKRPPQATLSAAAEAAAWFSEAREQSQVDVQWTRRKYVRRLRGAPPGTVRVKRSETLRVRPLCPTALSGTGN